MTTRKSGNPNKRPTFGGLPVPWVARFDSERPYPATNLRMGQIGDPSPKWVGEWTIVSMDPPHYQDSRHIWWVAHTPQRGGVPEFATLTPDRHRRCFDERRCQVCGLIIREPMSWLQTQAHLGDPTSHAPLHRKCVDVAIKLCPHWAHTPFVVLESDEWTPVKVYGDVLEIRNDSPYFARSETVAIDDPKIMRTMAKQLVVTIDNPREVMRRGRG